MADARTEKPEAAQCTPWVSSTLDCTVVLGEFRHRVDTWRP